MAYGVTNVSAAERITGDELALRAQDIYADGNSRMVMIETGKKGPSQTPSVRMAHLPALV